MAADWYFNRRSARILLDLGELLVSDNPLKSLGRPYPMFLRIVSPRES